MAAARTPEMAELHRLLTHARACDGITRDLAGKVKRCPTCDVIDRRLDDGPAYFGDDPADRLRKIDLALSKILQQAERVGSVVERSSLPYSARSAFAQVLEWLGQARGLVYLPIAEVPGVPKPIPYSQRSGPRGRVPSGSIRRTRQNT